MKTIAKKTISLLLALLLMFTSMLSSTAAFDVSSGEKSIIAMIDSAEYETLQAAIDAAQAGDTVTLTSDISAGEIITINKAITLEGNGKALTSTAARAINVSGADGVVIRNLTINASGERAINVIQNATNISIEEVTATAANYTVNVASSAPGSVIRIKDSTLTGLCTVNVSAADADVELTDSTINCNDYNETEGEAYAALSLNKEATNGKIAANGCTINVVADSDSVPTRNAAENGSVTVDGSSEGVKNLCAVITYEGSPYYHGFTSLNAAIEFAKPGNTITLIRDIEESEIITINKAITLEGNGKALTSTAARAINVSGADGVVIRNLTINASGERAINVIQNATNISIEEVTATAANYTVNVASSAPGAVIRIKDSTLTGLCTVNVSAADADVELTDSTINCNDYNETEGEAYAALSLNKEATNGKIAANGCTINVVADSDSVPTRNAAENGSVTVDGSSEGVKNLCAVITYEGSPYYHGFTSLNAAIEFAKPGNTITLIRDIEESEIITINKSIAINLNGKSANAQFELSDYDTALTAAEGLNISSAINGHDVIYSDGKYTIDTEHDFSTWISNEEEHWQICACGETGSKAIHTWDSGKVTKEATCTEEGVTTYTCSVTECPATKTESISMKGHSFSDSYTVDKKATVSYDGSKSRHCANCAEKTDETVISRISSVTLSTELYTYNGKDKTPKVTVKDANGKKLTKNVDYKLSVASKRSGIGRYTVKVTFTGNYEGTKSVYFYIKPGKPSSVKSASQTTSSVKLSWSKVAGAAGYTVYRYSPSKKAYVKAGSTEGTTFTVKNLYAGTKYTFRVVAYGKTSGGKVYDSDSYALLKTATKTKTPELTKVTTTKGKATLTHTDVSGETGYTVYYSTKKDSGFRKYDNFKANTKAAAVTKLTSGKTYYFKVRTYIKTDSGYVYSAWSNIKGIKIK